MHSQSCLFDQLLISPSAYHESHIKIYMFVCVHAWGLNMVNWINMHALTHSGAWMVTVFVLSGTDS